MVFGCMNSAKMIEQARMTHWAQFIRDCKASGLSIKAYCEGHGVKKSAYYYWLKKLRDEACGQFLMSQMGDGSRVTQPNGFTEVRVSHSPKGIEAMSLPEEILTETTSVLIVEEATSTSHFEAPMFAPALTDSPKSVPAPPVAQPMPVHTEPEPLGQIQIETSGMKISADGTYPVDKLARVLKGLVGS